MKKKTSESGIALLITLLIMTVLLGVSTSLLNITLKQLQFASIGLASEMSFQAANAGMECMLFQDYVGYPASQFDLGQNSPTITCMGTTAVGTAAFIANGEEQQYTFSWGLPGAPQLCTNVSIFKFYDATNPVDMSVALRRAGTCAPGVSCTVIQSRGYNVACGSIGNARVIERELTQRY